MFQKAMKTLVAALPIVFAASGAICGNQVWGPSQFPQDSSNVGADYTHDDGGALIVACNTKSKLMSYFLVEPRANWKQGDKVSLTTKADDGSQSGPTTAIVISPHMIAVADQPAWDIATMGKATTFFAMGDGVHARIFPIVNFREATTPVLQACGDHW